MASTLSVAAAFKEFEAKEQLEVGRLMDEQILINDISFDIVRRKDLRLCPFISSYMIC